MKRFVLLSVACALPLLAAPVTVVAQEKLTVEQRLQRVEDELAIRRILVDYSATQDARDYTAYAALFTRTGEWVNGTSVYKGREAIHKMLVDLMRKPNGQPEPVLSGRYEDELIREDGKWKILRRVDYPVMPTPDEWSKYIRERRAAEQK